MVHNCRTYFLQQGGDQSQMSTSPVECTSGVHSCKIRSVKGLKKLHTKMRWISLNHINFKHSKMWAEHIDSMQSHVKLLHLSQNTQPGNCTKSKGQDGPWHPRCQCHCVPCWWRQQTCSSPKRVPGPDWLIGKEIRASDFVKLKHPFVNTWQRHGTAWKDKGQYCSPEHAQALAPSGPMRFNFMLRSVTDVFVFKAWAIAWMKYYKIKMSKEIKAGNCKTGQKMWKVKESE